MEYRILICDDLQLHDDILEKHINNCLKEKTVKYVCDKTTSGINAIEMYTKQKYDMLFLDIDMPDCRGIEVAEKIFDIDPNAIIIYVTAYPQYAEKAYEQYAFQYITKPINEFRLGIILWKAIEKIEKDILYNNDQSFFILRKNSKDIKIMNRDVIYFEKVINYITVYMEAGQKLNIRITLKEIENIVNMKMYLRCHNGFIVNRSKIRSISGKEIDMFNTDKIIPVGRGYKEMVLEEKNNMWNII